MPKTWVCSVVSVCTRPLLLTSCSHIQNMDMPYNMENIRHNRPRGGQTRGRHSTRRLGRRWGCLVATPPPSGRPATCSGGEWEFFPFRSALARVFLGTSRGAGRCADGARSSGLARWKASRSAHRHMWQGGSRRRGGDTRLTFSLAVPKGRHVSEFREPRFMPKFGRKAS